MKKKFGVYLFVACFFLISAYCIYGGYINAGGLSGVIQDINPQSATLDGIMDGTYQTYLEEVWNAKFPGKTALIKTRNQILYSLFRSSPNQNVVLGQNNCLIEPPYIYNEMLFLGQPNDESLDLMINNLVKLRTLLEENDKLLYIFISPSKAHFKTEDIPYRFKLLDRRDEFDETYRDRFTRALEENNFVFVDSTEYIESNRDKFSAPVFFQSGDHWSRPWGNFAAAELIRKIGLDSGFDLDQYSIEEYISDAPIFPDTDLYDSLNLWKKATDTWYGSNLIKTKNGTDKPNVFFRGCSFMEESLMDISLHGCFNDVVYLKNFECYTNNYSKVDYMTNNFAYDELPIDSLLGNSDILFLESSSLGLDIFSFGFVDYLLEHPEYLDRVY